jgi:DNA primase
MAAPDIIQEIKERVDLLEVISEYVKLRPTGGRHVGLCPFHNEKTGSFYVNSDRGTWHCFGCGEGGDVIKFIEKIENLSFREAAERLARRVGLEWPQQGRVSSSEKDRLRAMNEAACRFFERELPRSESAMDYLKSRGVDAHVAKAFRIGFAPDSWESLRNHLRSQKFSDEEMIAGGLIKRRPGERAGGYDLFRNRLMFPIADSEGRIIAFGGRIFGDEGPKYINSPETPLFVKRRVLYASHRAAPKIKESRTALVMEGYMDVIAAHEFGFAYAVAPLGTALTEDHLQSLRRMCDRVILVFDADGAGMRAALRSLSLFEKTELDVRIATLAMGEDPDSFLRKRGAAAFSQQLSEAKPILDYRIEAILSQNDVQNDLGYAKAMKEIVPLLRQVTAPDRWIHRLSEIRSEGMPERVAFHEADIRRMIDRNVGESMPEPARKTPTTEMSDEPRVSTAIRKLHKAEEMILWACLQNAEIAETALAKLSPELFIRPAASELAILIRSRIGDKEWEPELWASDSEEAMDLARRLLTGPDLIHDSAPGNRERWLNQATDLLLRHSEREQIKSLTAGRTPTTEELKRIRELYDRRQNSETR